MSTMTNIGDIFRAFGGPTALASALGISPVHAGMMKTRGSIPGPYWADLVAAARKRRIDGVTLQLLADISRSKRERRA